MSDQTYVEIVRTVRRRLPKRRWKEPQRSGFLTDALAGFMFVLIAGGGWLFIEAASADEDANAGATIAALGR